MSYKIMSGTEAAQGTVTATVSTTNYEDIKLTLAIETVDLPVVELKEGSGVNLRNATLTEGEKLSKLSFAKAVFVNTSDEEVPGTLSFCTPDEVLSAGTWDVDWVFEPEGDYARVYGSVTVTVKKRTASESGSGGTQETTSDGGNGRTQDSVSTTLSGDDGNEKENTAVKKKASVENASAARLKKSGRADSTAE